MTVSFNYYVQQARFVHSDDGIVGGFMYEADANRYAKEYTAKYRREAFIVTRGVGGGIRNAYLAGERLSDAEISALIDSL